MSKKLDGNSQELKKSSDVQSEKKDSFFFSLSLSLSAFLFSHSSSLRVINLDVSVLPRFKGSVRRTLAMLTEAEVVSGPGQLE